MTPSIDPGPVRAVVTDIEGTTSAIRFVHEVLFPYARERLPAFIAEHGSRPDVRALLDDVSAEAGRPLTDDEAAEELVSWIDADRKATPLKALQGLIWEHGYRAGHFTGHVHEDAARRLAEWRDRGLSLYVYSSGSVHAQKLLFGHSDHGDLTPLFAGWFDTTTGHKREAESYRRIVEATGFEARSMLFLSDVIAELDAARSAGMQTTWLRREGEPAASDDHDGAGGALHPEAPDFDAIPL